MRANKTKVYSTPRQWLITFLLMFLAMMISFAANALYTNKVDRESNQAWCDIINGLAKRNSVIENPDPDTLEFRRQLNSLIAKYGC